MNPTRKLHPWLAMLAIPALFALVLVACGDDDDDDDDDSVESPTAPAAETPTDAVTPTTPEDGETPTEEPAEQLGSIDVISLWGEEEEQSFRAMVAPWEEETGGQMQYTGTRDLTQQLIVRVEGGNPPDVAIPPEVGLMTQFAREGRLVPLDECPDVAETVRGEYGDAFIELGSVDGELYGVIMKVDNKGTIFYNPRLFEENGWEPLDETSTWDDLIALADQIVADGFVPFSMGLESAESTGWPATDWIQQILLGQQGLEVYNGVIDGTVPFNDPAVRDAWERFGQIAQTEGYVAQVVPDGVLATGYTESTYLPFEDPPQAAMVYLGSFAAGFIQDQFPDLVPGEDYAFMPFPDGAVTGAFNVAYAFNSEPTTCSFLAHLASAEAQQIWVDRGGFNSANQNIDFDGYENPVDRAAAEGLLEAEVFAGDLDDLVGGQWQLAFFAAVIEYLRDPGQLDSLLANVDQFRQEQ